MATAETLIAGVIEMVCGSPDATSANILPLLNEGLRMITGRILLPPLETFATVNTTLSANTSALPANYQHGLFAAQDGVKTLGIKNSKGQMITAFGDLTQAGDVEAVAVVGSSLMYLPIPSTVVPLTIHYYRLPALLVALASPEGFTPQNVEFGEKAMKHYAAASLWSNSEDGIDGEKVNTLYHEGQFEVMIARIQEITTEGVSPANPPYEVLTWL